MEKPNVILEWQIPKEECIDRSKKALKRGIKMSFITLSISAVLELVIYWGFIQFRLEELEFNFKKVLILAYLASAGLCLVCFIIDPFFKRYRKILYQISEKGIVIKLDSERLLRWEKIEDYYLTNNKSLAGFYIIKYWFLGMERDLIVPTKEIADKILKIFEERAKKKEPREVIKLKRWQLCFMLTLCAIYLVVFICLVKIFPSIKEFLKEYLILVSLLFGPGTIAMMCLFGLKTFKSRNGIFLAIAFNYLVVICFGLLIIIIKYYEFYKIFNTT